MYRKYLLVVLAGILASNWLDRVSLGLVLQAIKVDLHLSDTQLGLLTGIAFAFFYSLMGIPIARWADRGNRVTIISLTTFLWSVAVVLCGTASSFLQLLLIRMGVAIGEAGCVPTAHSLIADTFSRAERPRAVARYMLGGPLSLLIGNFLGGWLNEFFGWRRTFAVLGLPGLALAVLAFLTLRDPRTNQLAHGTFPVRPDEGDSAAAPPVDLSFVRTGVTLWRNLTFRHLLFGFSVMSLFGYGIGQWQPAFFIRSYGLKTGELGTWLAVIYGFGGLLGTYVGGELASRLAARDEGLQLRAMAIVYSSFGIITPLIYLSPTYHLAFGWAALAVIGGGMATGPLFATVQTLVPQRMRAMSVALIFLSANLIGMGLGPLLAGVLSDAFRPLFGEESLRYSLLALCPGYFWAGWHLWRASRTVTRDLQAVTSDCG